MSCQVYESALCSVWEPGTQTGSDRRFVDYLSWKVKQFAASSVSASSNRVLLLHLHQVEWRNWTTDEFNQVYMFLWRERHCRIRILIGLTCQNRDASVALLWSGLNLMTWKWVIFHFKKEKVTFSERWVTFLNEVSLTLKDAQISNKVYVSTENYTQLLCSDPFF